MSFSVPVAFSLRIWLMAPERTATACMLMGIALAVGYHLAWHGPASRTLHVPWREWFWANNGFIFGIMRDPPRGQWYAEAIAARGLCPFDPARAERSRADMM